jgi:crotonobetainyl-CoA:carnitine CoA-transferase CaiB-like acyl-CoA transferase
VTDPQPAPLEGIRVVEFGAMAAAPACAMLLAAWGADVVKIERPGGDPARRAGASPKTDAAGRTFNPRFELHNRGKRSIILDLATADGAEAARRLVDGADVFVTNALPRSLRRFGLDVEPVRARNPRLVYGQITSYGVDHPGEDRASFDHGAFWAHTGMAAAFTAEGAAPPQPTGGMGDRTAGANLAGAICAALLRRVRTGLGGYVSTSLARTGIWLQGSDLADTLATGDAPPPRTRHRTPTPLLNAFRAADGRWFWLQVMHPAKDFGALRTALAGHELDPAVFGDGDPAILRAHAAEVVDALDRITAAMPLDELARRFDACGIRWAPVLTRAEVLADPLIRASGAVVTRDGGEGDALGDLALAPPCDIDGFRGVPSAPGVGEHTAEIMASLASDLPPAPGQPTGTHPFLADKETLAHG